MKSNLSRFLLALTLLLGETNSLWAQEKSNSRSSSERARSGSKAPPSGPAESAAISPAVGVQGDKVSLNFIQADLLEVIRVFGRYLKLNYTLDPAVKGTVTIYASEPMEREHLLPVFHQILRMNNTVAVRSGDLYHIVPIERGKGLAQPGREGREDSYALQVVPVGHLSAGEMKKILAPFVTAGGEISEVDRGNLLIIADLPSNIHRLMQIKELIDINALAGMHMEIYQVKEANVEELAEEMSKIMHAHLPSLSTTEETSSEKLPTRFIPIPRNNKLLIISRSKATWTTVKQWLEQIDAVREGPGKRVFIYSVQNVRAVELAEILKRIYAAPATSSEPGTGRPRREGPAFTSREPAASPAPASLAQAPIPAPASGAPVAPPGAASLPVFPTLIPPAAGEIRIDADPATNSLIILATAREYENVREVLKRLDIRPRQVLMEVLVAEVTLTDDLALGVDYAIRRRGSASAVNELLQGKGNLIGTLPSSFPAGLTSIITANSGDFRAVINALMDTSRVKVLSNPSILASDNQPARMQVGSEEPVATGTTTSQVGTAASSTTIEFRNTGRILTILPQVSSEGSVNLRVKIEVSERGELIRVGSDEFFSFDTRDAETSAVVQDGDTLVIGGIMTEKIKRDRAGIPYLMDVPIVGRFFGLTTDNVERSELVILITPHVVRDRKEGEKVTKDFMERLDMVTREVTQIKKAKANGVDSGAEAPKTPTENETSTKELAPTIP